MLKSFLDLIIIGAKTLSKERSLYYIKKATKLQEKIFEVEDSDFYNKDMEAKGKAERELASGVHNLRLEFVKEAKWERF